jgi:hypothetical protein
MLCSFLLFTAIINFLMARHRLRFVRKSKKSGRRRHRRRRHRRGRKAAAAAAAPGLTPQNLFPYGVASSLLP